MLFPLTLPPFSLYFLKFINRVLVVIELEENERDFVLEWMLKRKVEVGGGGIKKMVPSIRMEGYKYSLSRKHSPLEMSNDLASQVQIKLARDGRLRGKGAGRREIGEILWASSAKMCLLNGVVI